jgi:DNA-binding GntR family transcriptional regulator
VVACLVPRRMTAAQIAADMEERIRSGEYPAGSRLPSYRELGDIYSKSFSTIAKVVLMLKERGLVEGEPGVGVFVRE